MDGIRRMAACRFTRKTILNIGFLSVLVPFAVMAEEVAITVNNTDLPAAQLELFVGQFVAQGAENNKELRGRLVEELATRETVAQEAIHLGLDNMPGVQAALANARRDVLVNAFIANHTAHHPVAEEEVREAYEKRKVAAGVYEYRVRHVLVKTEAEAREIHAALKKRGNMETLARAKSLDSASRANGGDIGWQLPMALLPAAQQVIAGVGKGEFSEPVESRLGWHILKVEDIRPYEFPAYNEISATLRQQLQEKSYHKAIAALRERARVRTTLSR